MKGFHSLTIKLYDVMIIEPFNVKKQNERVAFIATNP